MKKNILLLIGFIAAAFCLNAFAEIAPFRTGPAPIQDYHSVADNTDTNKNASAAKLAAAMAAQIHAAAPVTNDIQSGAALSNTETSNAGLQQQISQTDQAIAEYEQQTNKRIQNLVDSNHAIGDAINVINSQLSQLQQSVKTLQAPLPALKNPASTPTSFLNNKNQLFYLDFGAIVVFLIAICIMTGRYMQRKPVAAVPLSDTAEEKSDFDFMATAEAIPAKLDLARSYITMGEYDAAKKILKSVIASSTPERGAEAKALLDQINQT